MPSPKHRSLFSANIRNKYPDWLPGINGVLAGRLYSAGYTKVSCLLDQLLVFDKHKAVFTSWMRGVCGANIRQSSDCYKCLVKWSKNSPDTSRRTRKQRGKDCNFRLKPRIIPPNEQTDLAIANFVTDIINRAKNDVKKLLANDEQTANYNVQNGFIKPSVIKNKSVPHNKKIIASEEPTYVSSIPVTVSQKHRTFLSAVTGNKTPESLPGISDILGGRLYGAGYTKASDVLNQLLQLDQDVVLFTTWMYRVCGANIRQSTDCYNCLVEYCKNYPVLNTRWEANESVNRPRDDFTTKKNSNDEKQEKTSRSPIKERTAKKNSVNTNAYRETKESVGCPRDGSPTEKHSNEKKQQKTKSRSPLKDVADVNRSTHREPKKNEGRRQSGTTFKQSINDKKQQKSKSRSPLKERVVMETDVNMQAQESKGRPKEGAITKQNIQNISRSTFKERVVKQTYVSTNSHREAKESERRTQEGATIKQHIIDKKQQQTKSRSPLKVGAVKETDVNTDTFSKTKESERKRGKKTKSRSPVKEHVINGECPAKATDINTNTREEKKENVGRPREGAISEITSNGKEQKTKSTSSLKERGVSKERAGKKESELNRGIISANKTNDFLTKLSNFTESFMVFLKLDGTDEHGLILGQTVNYAEVDDSRALLFNGKDAFAQISPKPIQFDKLNFTMGVSVKLNSVGKKQVIVSDWKEPYVFRVEISSENSIGIVLRNVNGENLFLTSLKNSVIPNRWYKLCFTWNYARRSLAIWQDTKKLVNGLNMHESSTHDLLGYVRPDPPPDEHKIAANTHSTWELGCNKESNGFYFDGYMRNFFYILEDIPSDDQMVQLLI